MHAQQFACPWTRGSERLGANIVDPGTPARLGVNELSLDAHRAAVASHARTQREHHLRQQVPTSADETEFAQR